jgi:hypothetical protein
MTISNPFLRYLTLLLMLALPCAVHAQGGELIRNGGMEGGSGNDGHGGGIPEWAPYGAGYEVDRREHHGGDQCIRCDSLNANAQHGAQITLNLNQTQPVPIRVSGWSKADGVHGLLPADYSLYIDALYTDGTPLYGELSAFRAGTHDWQRRQVLLLPTKPLKTVTIYALFRNHTGTAWFDDFSAQAAGGASRFDSQPITLPTHPNGPTAHRVATSDGLALELDAAGDVTAVRLNDRSVNAGGGGFYVRDVAADGPPVAMRGATSPRKAGGINLGCASGPLHLDFNAAVYSLGDCLEVDGEIDDLTKTDRAVTVYLALPVDAVGWQWGQDIRHAETVTPNREYTDQTHVNVGATGGLSLYPFACVADSRGGVALASQQDWPSVYRLFYHGPSRHLVIAWDLAMTGKTAAWPSHNARFRCRIFRVPPGAPDWGFRRAADRFYHLYSRAFARRATAEGIWMPFTDPSKVENAQDFHFAYHEGDNSVKSDNAHGILSFRYSEPSTYWLPMPPEMPRTYENALGLIQANSQKPETPAKDGEPSPRDWARAVLSSGTQDAGGQFNLEFRNEPWANGAVFVLDPNPEFGATADRPTRASLNYSLEAANSRYSDAATAAHGRLDGEYLDSLESWTDTQDYRPSDLAACPYPLPYDTDSHEPTLPQWYSLHTFVRFVSQDLHNRDRLLMANTTPVRFSIFAPLLDVMGIETNWLDEQGRWQPDDDAIFNFRRTMSCRKPYLLLMNTDYDRFTHPMVEKYLQRSLFYGVYPSMFSANAADHPYWETPRWYNRDRDLFKKYIPILQRLSVAGWEPVTEARASDPTVYVERYGARLFTLLNSSAQSHEVTVRIDLHALNLPGTPKVVNLITGATLPATLNAGALNIPISLQPEEVAALELQAPGR